MVAWLQVWTQQTVYWWVLAQSGQPQVAKLPPRQRAKALAALGGLVILGAALIAFTWWGGRFVRRYMRGQAERAERRTQNRTPARVDDWAEKPLHPTEELET